QARQTARWGTRNLGSHQGGICSLRHGCVTAAESRARKGNRETGALGEWQRSRTSFAENLPFHGAGSWPMPLRLAPNLVVQRMNSSWQFVQSAAPFYCVRHTRDCHMILGRGVIIRLVRSEGTPFV